VGSRFSHDLKNPIQSYSSFPFSYTVPTVGTSEAGFHVYKNYFREKKATRNWKMKIYESNFMIIETQLFLSMHCKL